MILPLAGLSVRAFREGVSVLSPLRLYKGPDPCFPSLWLALLERLSDLQRRQYSRPTLIDTSTSLYLYISILSLLEVGGISVETIS